MAADSGEPTRRTEPDDVEVVRWYTRARRFPQLIGRTPDGATIWGGPYTYTQVIGGVLFLVLGAKTAWLWGRFGLVGNAVILLGATYALVLALGRLPIGSRNPLSVATGTVRALIAPTAGRLGGRPLRSPRPHRTVTHLVIDIPDPPTPDPATDPLPTAEPATPATPVLALTGVQRLLAGLPAEES